MDPQEKRLHREEGDTKPSAKAGARVGEKVDEGRHRKEGVDEVWLTGAREGKRQEVRSSSEGDGGSCELTLTGDQVTPVVADPLSLIQEGLESSVRVVHRSDRPEVRSIRGE